MPPPLAAAILRPMHGTVPYSPLRRPAHTGPKDRFREQFQRSLRACLRKGFSIEECFGLVWVETWEEISLSEQEQAELFEELLGWARMAPR